MILYNCGVVSSSACKLAALEMHSRLAGQRDGLKQCVLQPRQGLISSGLHVLRYTNNASTVISYDGTHDDKTVLAEAPCLTPPIHALDTLRDRPMPRMQRAIDVPAYVVGSTTEICLKRALEFYAQKVYSRSGCFSSINWSLFVNPPSTYYLLDNIDINQGTVTLSRVIALLVGCLTTKV